MDGFRSTASSSWTFVGSASWRASLPTFRSAYSRSAGVISRFLPLTWSCMVSPSGAGPSVVNLAHRSRHADDVHGTRAGPAQRRGSSVRGLAARVDVVDEADPCRSSTASDEGAAYVPAPAGPREPGLAASLPTARDGSSRRKAPQPS